MQPCLSDRVYISFIPPHMSLPVNLLSVLQASGRFSQPQTVGKLLPAPLLLLVLLFSRCAHQSRKLIALSLLTQMKDLGNVQV